MSGETVSGDEVLQDIYDAVHFDAFDSNLALIEHISEAWDSQSLYFSRVSDTWHFRSDDGSKFTYKFKSTDTTDTYNGDFKGGNGDILKYSESDTYKETPIGTSGTLKVFSTYQEGGGTPDKTDDLKLSVAYSGKYFMNNDGDQFPESESGSVSYSDGNGVKYSLKFSDSYKNDTFIATVSDMSYSDADGNKFKFSGSIDQDGTIKVGSLSITIMDGETLKLGKTIIEDSGYTYDELLALGTNANGVQVFDFNGTDDGGGSVVDFMDNYAANWMDIIQSQ